MSKNKNTENKKPANKKVVGKKSEKVAKVSEKAVKAPVEKDIKENHTHDESCATSLCGSKKSCSKLKLFLVVALIIVICALLAYKFGNKGDSATSAEVEVKKSSNSGKKVETVGDVEEVVTEWVKNNPEVIVEAVVNMQQKKAQQQVQEAGKNIAKKHKDLYNHKGDPVIEPAGYDVAVVQFFDYNCGYCKKAYPTIQELVSKDKKVKVVFKELPILGPLSEEFAKISIAFNMIAPSKYFQFHGELMSAHFNSGEEAIAMAEKYGVSADKIKKVLEKFKDDIAAEIKFNRELATAIGVNGTPAFLIGDKLFPGAVSYDALEAEIKKQR